MEPFTDAQSALAASDDIHSNVRFVVVDSGIGSYEYWGSRERDDSSSVEARGSGKAKVEWVVLDDDSFEVPTKLSVECGYEDSYTCKQEVFTVNARLVDANVSRKAGQYHVEATYYWEA